MKKNYYETLEVSPNASPEVIEKAYKTLTRKYHPDVHSKDTVQNAEIKFKEIVKAYTTLSDPERRAEYDELEKLKMDVSSLKNENGPSQPTKQNDYNLFSYARECIRSVSTSLYNHTKKSPEDRSKDLKALGIALSVMVILIILFWKVPFFRNLLNL